MNISEASFSAYKEDLQLLLGHLDISVVEEKASEAKILKKKRRVTHRMTK